MLTLWKNECYARYTLHAYEIYTRWHTPGIHVRGRSGSLLPPWVASLGSQDRDRPACCSAMHANDRYVALHRSCASPRANTGRFKNISFFPFFFLFRLRPSAQSKAFIISLLRRVPPRREREISILRKLTRKLNRSNFLPSLSASIHHLDHDSRVLEDLYISAIRREITPIITTLPWWIYDMRYLCVIRLLVDRICVTRIIPSRLFLSVSRERK